MAPVLPQALGDVEGKGRGGRDARRSQVLQEEVLAGCVAGGDRDHGQPDPFRPIVETKASGEETVAEGHVQKVAGAGSGSHHGARHDFSPEIEVGRGVPDHGRLASGAGGGMQPSHLAERHCEEPERILLAQVGLGGERQMREIIERLEGVLREPSLIERNPGTHPRQHRAQPVELERAPPRSR